MNRRQFVAAAAAATAFAGDRKPNFVFIVSDDHHYQCLGAAGNPHIRTPNLDRLAERGVLFTNGTISTPQCCPSRGVLLSGRETFESGLRSNGATSFRPGLGPTVIEQLRRSGYDTALVGKWHITPRPADCGFTRAPLWLKEGSSKYMDPVLIRGLDGAKEEVKGHITHLFTDAAVEVIRSAKQPFFLWLTYNAPHGPLYASEEYTAMYAGKSDADLAPPAHPKNSKPFKWGPYYAAISELDAAIGRIVRQLEESKQWANTVVVFVGDNGFLCGTKGLSGKVHPWEESVRVPMLAAGGPVRRGVRELDPVASIDLPATWLDFAGVNANTSGRSLRPLLESGKRGPREAFSVWDDGRVEALTIRVAVEPYRVVRTRQYKFIVWESKKQALYDHVADPGEEKNLIDHAAFAATAKDMRARLTARMKATGDHAIAWLA